MRGDILGRLRWDQMLSNGFILVKVKDARVSLSGYVGTLGQKLRAEREAWIPGVKDVSSDDLQVKWWDEDEDMRHAQYGDYTDQEITAAIKRAFSFDPRLNGSHITPAVFGGIATLTGTAVNLRARQTAQQIAQDTVGVERVTSSVRVAGGETLDAYLRHKVRKALSYNPITESQDIDVDVHLGRVSLTGTVNGLAAKAEAKRLAQTIAGVRAVDNEVTVTSPPPRAVSTWADTRSSLPLKTDLEVQGDIRHGLESSLDIRPDQIDVRVVEGVATLKGKVDSVRALREAEAIAYGAGAVETVDKLDIA
jgi:hyperosmotically inducible protein